jgi:hypothetical protein
VKENEDEELGVVKSMEGRGGRDSSMSGQKNKNNNKAGKRRDSKCKEKCKEKFYIMKNLKSEKMLSKYMK